MTEKKEMKQKNEMNEVLMFTPVIETVGARLKKCREEKKIKLSQISKALCIRESFLVALEEGEYEVFPALVYAGGFLRSYAVYLGMDEKEVMKQFHKETEYLIEKSAEAPVVTNKNIIPSKKLLFFLLFVLGIGYGIVHTLNNQKELTPVIEKAPVEISSAQPQAVAPVLEEVVLSETEPVKAVEELKSSETEPNRLETLSKELKEAVPGSQNEPENPFTGTVYGQKEGSRVSILATNTVWLEIKSGDSVVFTRVLKQGDSYNAPTEGEPVILKTGNAGAVSIYVDGEFKKVLGRFGHVVKDIKLVPETFLD